MADYVRVMIAIAAQWRVLQAIGPTASALIGVPVSQPRPAATRPAQLVLPVAARAKRLNQPKKGGSGTGR